jgi:hypothetical protein
MKVHFLTITTVGAAAALALASAAVLPAQDALRYPPRFNMSAYAGALIPTGNLRDSFDTGLLLGAQARTTSGRTSACSATLTGRARRRSSPSATRTRTSIRPTWGWRLVAPGEPPADGPYGHSRISAAACDDTTFRLMG